MFALDRVNFIKRLKTARIVRVHKGGPHSTMSNYRPMSIVPSFAKILEKIVVLQLYNFFEESSLITESQLGFRAGKSTEKAAYTLFDTVPSKLDRDNFTINVFLGLAKHLIRYTVAS